MKCKNLKLLNALCVVIFMLFGCTQPEPPHVHTFSEAWTTDATSHWHAATCEHTTEVSGKVDHQFPEIWNLVTSATEEAAGLEERFCEVCNYRATQVIPQLNHNHDIAKVWSTDSTKHWHTASCGREEHNEDVGEHTEDSGTVTTEPTCGTKGVKTFKCSVCDAVLKTEDIPETGLHTEDSGTVTTPVTLTTEGIKTYKCTVCKAILRTVVLPCPELYSTPIDATTEAPPTAESKYIYFGVFPRDVLPTTSTVTVDETVFVKMGANTYYLGSDGNYYAKCAEKAWGTDAEYKYHDGTQPGRGGTTTRYFKVEPIKWRVLTDNYSGKKLLLAEDILTANVPYYVSSSNRTIGTTEVYANNYKYSTIRAYLNGAYESDDTQAKTYDGSGFLQTAFTSSAQTLISKTTVDNSKKTTGYNESSYATKYACENTEDKIFLLSESEVINSDYGFATYGSYGKGNARIRFPTDYAKANYAWQRTDDGFGGYWWLRSPHYSESDGVRGVSYGGDAHLGSYVDITYYGVVPALSISF